jgi:hypothetical protein
MIDQSWVGQTPARSIADEPDSMVAAAENRRRILGSSIFGGTGNQEYSRRTQPEPPPEAMTQTRGLPPQRYEQRDSGEPPSFMHATMPASSGGSAFSFPDFNFEPSLPPENFSLTFQPRPTLKSGPAHRLDVPPNPQMRRLRDELNRDTEQFTRRLRQIGQA